MIRRPPRSTLTDTLFPYTTLCRSCSFLFAASSDSSPITTSIRLASPKLIRSILDMLCSHRQPVIHACQAAARAPVDPDDPPPLFDPVAMAAAFPVAAGADSAWWLGVCGMDMAARAGRDRAAGAGDRRRQPDGKARAGERRVGKEC